MLCCAPKVKTKIYQTIPNAKIFISNTFITMCMFSTKYYFLMSRIMEKIYSLSIKYYFFQIPHNL